MASLCFMNRELNREQRASYRLLLSNSCLQKHLCSLTLITSY